MENNTQNNQNVQDTQNTNNQNTQNTNDGVQNNQVNNAPDTNSTEWLDKLDSIINKRIDGLAKSILKDNGVNDNDIKDIISQFKNITELDRYTVETLIDYIEVGGNKNDRIIKIHWNF
jgi:hypothetical protein